MSEWFEKGCKYFCGQWEDNEITGGLDYKEYEPILTFCNHESNPDEYEGNCNKRLCPIIFEKGDQNENQLVNGN